MSECIHLDRGEGGRKGLREVGEMGREKEGEGKGLREGGRGRERDKEREDVSILTERRGRKERFENGR